ncbi:hypothetical protein, partial [Streptomyces sp. NP160]|uniref:hypothetical protein n=1 Tax=Streptomyces sp. NP160 TaxID=2586637 RepID=UPI001C56456D
MPGCPPPVGSAVAERDPVGEAVADGVDVPPVEEPPGVLVELPGVLDALLEELLPGGLVVGVPPVGLGEADGELPAAPT